MKRSKKAKRVAGVLVRFISTLRIGYGGDVREYEQGEEARLTESEALDFARRGWVLPVEDKGRRKS